MLIALNAFKPNSSLEAFILACKADARGRTGFEQIVYPQADLLTLAATTGATIDTSTVLNGKLQGADIGIALRELRIKAVAKVINQHKPM